MNDLSDPCHDAADERRFALTVWPRTPGRPWQAEVMQAGSAQPIRFDLPVDLVLFLTELAGPLDTPPRGLR
jgi:hypothetical protein